MNKHYILSMMAAAVLLAGCSDIAEEQETRTPIRLITSIAPTRATTTQDVQIADGQNLYVWATAGASPYLTAWRLTADGAGGFSSQSSTPYYPNSPLAMTYIHGNIQPAIVDEKTELPATMSHTVKIDQRQAADYAISDLLYLNEASVSAQNTHAITLQHKLSKIAIVLTSSEYSNDLLAKADVRICGIKPQIAITTADGTLADATQGTQPATIRPYQSSASTPEFEAIIPCKQVKPDKLITISLNGQTAQLNPTAPADAAQFESGKKYTYTITVSQTAITFANSTITNWTDYSGSTPINNVDSHNTIDIRRNPLWYVSKSNLNQDGTSFSTVASTSQGYLFTWASAMALGYTASTSSYDGYAMPTTPKSVTNDLDRGTWHMPTRMECKSIIPSDGNTDYIYTYIPAATVFTEPVCTFGYNDDTKFGEGNTSNPATPVGTAFKSYWSTYVADSYVRYAIRFLGTPYCSVWKYQGLDMASNSSTGRNIISSRLIDKINPDETARLEAMMTTITAADYNWTENENEGAVQRVFYNCGWNTAAQAAPGQSNGQWAFNWSTTEKSDQTTHSYCMRFSESLLYTPADYKTHGFSVRLFRDNCPGKALELAEVGDIICGHGKAHAATSGDIPCGTVKAGMVAYKNGENGIVISLTNMGSTKRWTDIANSNDNPQTLSHTPAVVGHNWVCGSKTQYTNMWGNSGGCGSWSNLNTMLTNIGGTSLGALSYWSCTENGSNGWSFDNATWYGGNAKSSGGYIRPVFAF